MLDASVRTIGRAAAMRLHVLKARLTSKERWAAPVDSSVLERRNRLLRSVIPQIVNGMTLDMALSGFRGTDVDERIVEYAAAASFLVRTGPDSDVLDVGCVLNNLIIDDVLDKHVGSLWLANVAQEPIMVTCPVFYHLAPIADAFPKGPKFSRITCLSTIEHVGFDNRHYGVSSKQRYFGVDTEPLVASVVSLARLLEPNGKLLVSVPFGHAEVLRHPRSGYLSMQVFGAESARAAVLALESMGFRVDASVWESGQDGWVRRDIYESRRRFCEGTPAASSVLIIEAGRT